MPLTPAERRDFFARLLCWGTVHRPCPTLLIVGTEDGGPSWKYERTDQGDRERTDEDVDMRCCRNKANANVTLLPPYLIVPSGASDCGCTERIQIRFAHGLRRILGDSGFGEPSEYCRRSGSKDCYLSGFELVGNVRPFAWRTTGAERDATTLSYLGFEGEKGRNAYSDFVRQQTKNRAEALVKLLATMTSQSSTGHVFGLFLGRIAERAIWPHMSHFALERDLTGIMAKLIRDPERRCAAQCFRFGHNAHCFFVPHPCSRRRNKFDANFVDDILSVIQEAQRLKTL